MFDLHSITAPFTARGKLRKSQRKTLAALVWALMRQPLLGIAAMGHSLAMAHTTTAKHAIKRVRDAWQYEKRVPSVVRSEKVLHVCPR